jgi:serine/threonine protein kinase
MAADRESQTMGLREAFFLNRLITPAKPQSPSGNDPTDGSLYIVKLIAVKEDADQRRAHNRSTSEAVQTGPRSRLTRQRSSTFGLPNTDDDSTGRRAASGGLGSPFLPTLAQSTRPSSAPSISRLILLLEHAPLGTMDRLLRTSPALVGKDMWEKWARQCVEALAWVHGKGIVHADIKPGNLLVREETMGHSLQLTHDLNIRLSDFGSSLLVHPAHPPVDGVGLGTLPFSPPELVDPFLSFSFPIDIFALGATLYQCITGREPYRGCRAVEMMHHVRKGDLWIWEERLRLGRVGEEVGGGSPYPSAWREVPLEGIRRGGSLRVSNSHARPPLSRMPSTESLRASDDVTEKGADSPAGVKLWATWARQPGSVPSGPIAALLDDNASPPLAHKELHGTSTATDDPISSITSTAPIISASYSDGSPVMVFLDGLDVLREAWRDVLKEMVDPDPSARPTAEELIRIWSEFDPRR